jgi:hypothetical protein
LPVTGKGAVTRHRPWHRVTCGAMSPVMGKGDVWESVVMGKGA